MFIDRIKDVRHAMEENEVEALLLSVGVLGPDDFKLVKGEKFLKIYQYHTKTAKHYFCINCGIHTHNRPRSNPKIYGVNIACVEGIKPFEIKDVPVNDGENHPLDKK
tara:strand:- start:134 stop:454 length:321 start_codon:yes stop_codon:yes gene_type:complete